MPNDTLKPAQHKAIGALLSEPTIKDAAASAGVGLRTLHGWLDEPGFDSAYRLARRKAVQQATAALQRASAQAVGVLVELMNTSSRTSIRLAAAGKILDLAIKSIELDDLDQRLKVLEDARAREP